MTMYEIIAKLDTIANDADYEVRENRIDLTINNFEGFDEDWNEVMREMVDEEAVENVIDWLEENADRYERNLYTDFYFGDIVVTLGYTSFDI